MKKRLIALLLLAALSLTLLAACGTKEITEEEAQQIALKEANLTADQVDDVHIHKTTNNGENLYQVHITAGNKEVTVYINQKGEVLGKF